FYQLRSGPQSRIPLLFLPADSGCPLPGFDSFSRIFYSNEWSRLRIHLLSVQFHFVPDPCLLILCLLIPYSLIPCSPPSELTYYKNEHKDCKSKHCNAKEPAT